MISFADRLRLAQVDIQMDAFFRARCPECSATTLYLRDDASAVDCRSCEVSFTDGSLVLPSSRQAHCHICHLVCAGNLEMNVKRCIPCQVAFEQAGQGSDEPRPLSTISYALNFRDLLNDVPDPQELHEALARRDS